MKIIQDLLTPNKYSRPEIPLEVVKGIVVHYVANKNTSAKANRNFFELREDGSYGFGSTHYIIGLEGEIIQCVPENEVCYHVGAKKYIPGIQDKLGKKPNYSTIGIETCHITDTGVMTPKTRNTLVIFVTQLLKKYNLSIYELFRHFDITGKICPRFFVDNTDEWDRFRIQVNNNL